MLNILFFYNDKAPKRIDPEWLYGYDIIQSLKKLHPEWVFIRYEGGNYDDSIWNDIDVYIRPNRHDGASRLIEICKKKNILYIWSYETGEYIEPDIDNIERRLIKLNEEWKMATKQGHPGRGGKGSCGGTRRKAEDGSGGGVGRNRNTSKQPKKKKK